VDKSRGLMCVFGDEKSIHNGGLEREQSLEGAESRYAIEDLLQSICLQKLLLIVCIDFGLPDQFRE
jgi:hypothetical protein